MMTDEVGLGFGLTVGVGTGVGTGVKGTDVGMLPGPVLDAPPPHATSVARAQSPTSTKRT